MLRSDEPPFRRARPVFRALLLAAAGLMLAQCDREADPPSPPAAPPAPAAAAPIIVTPSATLPTLSRAGLLESVNRAASAYAAGETADRSDPLVGRAFAIRLPFACSGPTPAAKTGTDGVPVAVPGPDGKTVRLALTPNDWTRSPLIAGASAGAQSGTVPSWEAVEGFWIPRPWLAAETCPVVRRDPSQAAAPDSPQSVGLASVFEAGGSRLTRRNGRAYAFTRRADGDEPLTAPTGGYRVLLEGRIAAFPNGRAIRCHAPGPDQRPVCVAAVQMDRVAFEDDAGAVLSEWRRG